MLYFKTKANGLNADLERHAAAEAKLRKLLAECEDAVYRKAYEQCLQQLLQSKAEVVAQIGRKKMKMRLRQKV